MQLNRSAVPEAPTQKDLFCDLLDSPAWRELVDLSKQQASQFKKTLLLRHVISPEERAYMVGRLASLHALLASCYTKAGREVPESLEVFFTGESNGPR